jgi:hypothetical protein
MRSITAKRKCPDLIFVKSGRFRPEPMPISRTRPAAPPMTRCRYGSSSFRRVVRSLSRGRTYRA